MSVSNKKIWNFLHIHSRLTQKEQCLGNSLLNCSMLRSSASFNKSQQELIFYPPKKHVLFELIKKIFRSLILCGVENTQDRSRSLKNSHPQVGTTIAEMKAMNAAPKKIKIRKHMKFFFLKDTNSMAINKEVIDFIAKEENYNSVSCLKKLQKHIGTTNWEKIDWLQVPKNTSQKPERNQEVEYSLLEKVFRKNNSLGSYLLTDNKFQKLVQKENFYEFAEKLIEKPDESRILLLIALINQKVYLDPSSAGVSSKFQEYPLKGSTVQEGTPFILKLIKKLGSSPFFNDKYWIKLFVMIMNTHWTNNSKVNLWDIRDHDGSVYEIFLKFMEEGMMDIEISSYLQDQYLVWKRSVEPKASVEPKTSVGYDKTNVDGEHFTIFQEDKKNTPVLGDNLFPKESFVLEELAQYESVNISEEQESEILQKKKEDIICLEDSCLLPKEPLAPHLPVQSGQEEQDFSMYQKDRKHHTITPNEKNILSQRQTSILYKNNKNIYSKISTMLNPRKKVNILENPEFKSEYIKLHTAFHPKLILEAIRLNLSSKLIKKIIKATLGVFPLPVLDKNNNNFLVCAAIKRDNATVLKYILESNAFGMYELSSESILLYAAKNIKKKSIEVILEHFSKTNKINLSEIEFVYKKVQKKSITFIYKRKKRQLMEILSTLEKYRKNFNTRSYIEQTSVGLNNNSILLNPL